MRNFRSRLGVLGLAGVPLAIALASGDAAADASSLSDYFGPREIALGESRRAEAIGSLATTLNPAGLALDHALVIEGSFGYRGADGAEHIAVSACDSTVPVPGCFYYRYFAAEPEAAGMTARRRVHELGSVLSRAVSSFLAVGVNVHYFDYNSDVMGESDSSGFATDVGTVFKPTNVFSLAVVGYNLLAADSSQYPLAVGGGLSLRPASALGLSADGVWNLDADRPGKGRFGGGVEYFLSSADGQSGYPLRAGGVYDAALDAGYVTAGVGFASLKLALDVGLRKQVSGPGDELMLQAALRLFGPQAEAP
jgi:hypothetical protein